MRLKAGEQTQCLYPAWGLTKTQKLACAKGMSLGKAAVIQRSKRNRLMQLSPEGLPNVILPARTYSSFLLQGALACSAPGEERAQELPSTSLTSREAKALLCPCAICVSASCLATSKAQAVLSLPFAPGVCPAPPQR